MTRVYQRSQQLMMKSEEVQKARTEVDEAQKVLGDKVTSLKAQISNYNLGREALLRAMLEERNKTWCDRCHEVVGNKKVRLAFLEEMKFDYNFPMRKLVRLCPGCFKSLKARHGFGADRPKNADQDFFLIFIAKKQDDVYHCLRFGKWCPLHVGYQLDNQIPAKVERFCEEHWNLPEKFGAQVS